LESVLFSTLCCRSDELLTACHDFFDDRWSKRRTVTSLEWSTIFPELLLAAYHVNEEAVHDPQGVCLMWNMKYAKTQRPEYIFHCQSPLTSATLSKFHPNIVIGGTYSGQIVLWDSRSNKRTPVQRSPLTSWAHTHPVFAVTLVGTQNAHNIISLGSDGSLCAWSLEMLAQPREKTKVCEMSSGGLFDLYPTCMSFFDSDVNNYAVGAENGNAYCGQRHSRSVPCARLSFRGTGTPDKPGSGNLALNKCRWDSSGNFLAAGDNHGKVTVCSVHESLAQPNAEQWTEFARCLADLKQYNLEQDVRAEV
ncbi:Cytoplasmic dynein 1 intermediate chain 1, partial [Paragonimus kellicotti]